MDETKDVKFTRAHYKLKALDAAGQSYSDEFNETVCEFLRNAPAESQAELLANAVQRGYCPAPAAIVSGMPLWNVMDVAAFYELALIDADRRLYEKGANRFLLSDRGIL